MKTIILFLIIYLTGCQSNKEALKSEDSSGSEMGFKQQAPNTIKDNSTLVGAVIDSVFLLDDLNYKLVVTLQTAIPERFEETVAEPGRVVELQPRYIFNENKIPDLSHPVNKKLHDLRKIKKGGFFIGNITLTPDFKWYITAVEMFQNIPEGKSDEF